MNEKVNSLNISRAALLSTACFSLIMCFLQEGLHYSYITFFFIFFNAIASLFKDDNAQVSFENDFLRMITRNSVSFVELIAFPFYVSEIIMLHEVHVGNFMPAALGVLSEFYHLVFDRNQMLINICVYAYATALFGICLAFSNYFGVLSAVIFAGGELNSMIGKPIDDVPTFVQFSFFIAAFTLTAHFGIQVK